MVGKTFQIYCVQVTKIYVCELKKINNRHFYRGSYHHPPGREKLLITPGSGGREGTYLYDGTESQWE